MKYVPVHCLKTRMLVSEKQTKKGVNFDSRNLEENLCGPLVLWAKWNFYIKLSMISKFGMKQMAFEVLNGNSKLNGGFWYCSVEIEAIKCNFNSVKK